MHRLVEELRSHGEVDCPNCQHHFYLESGRLDELERKLDELDKIKAPPLSRREIAAELAKLDDWGRMDTQVEWGKLKDAVEWHEPRVTQRNIDEGGGADAAAQERVQVEARIAEIGQVSNYYEEALETRLAYEAQLASYERELRECEAWQLHQELAEARATEIKPLADRFPEFGLLKVELEPVP